MIVNKVELKIRVFFPKKSKLLNLPQSFLYSVKGRSAIPEITKRREKMKMSTALWKVEPTSHFISSLSMIVDLIDQLD